MLISSMVALFIGLLQIVPQTSFPDTISAEPQDSLSQNMQQEAEEEIPDTVYVWNEQFPETFEIGETDSTLRWVNLLNLFDKFNRERGVITSRMGTVGRMDGALIHAYSTRHLNLEMEGLNYNDPLTGNVNWNRLPIHKIADFLESDYGATYRSRVRLREHYLIQPRTYLNFDESKFNYRSLEFSYTQNFLKTTNLELSFWDRRDGGGFRSQAVDGQQLTARAYHQLSHRWLLKAGFINNSMDLGEPFGYRITDPELFTFNTFVASPNESNASSDYSTNDIYIQLHHRKDTLRTVSTKMGLHFQTDRRSLRYSADTLSTKIQRLELFSRQRISFSSTEFTGTGRLFSMREKEHVNLTKDNWLGGELSLDASHKIGEPFELNAHSSLKAWNDGRTTSELSGRIIFKPLDRFRISVFGGALSMAPDIQAAYWQSEEFSGSPDLNNEESQFVGIQSEIDFWQHLSFGIRGDIRETSNAIFLQNGQFQNIDSYTLTSGTAWLTLNSQNFEGEISGTFKSYSSGSLNPVNSQLDQSGERIWLKSDFYWKSYLFDRATFVKAGFSGIYSANPFRTAEFITPLNRWQHGTNEFVNPSFYRLDAEISARVRWFMVLLKWENLLDELEQPGYFESVGYPMPGQRFLFGVRILFTN